MAMWLSFANTKEAHGDSTNIIFGQDQAGKETWYTSPVWSFVLTRLIAATGVFSCLNMVIAPPPSPLRSLIDIR
jgi:hypothetical protein